MLSSDWDHAVINLEGLDLADRPPLQLNDSPSLTLGSAIVVMGFQFDQSHLSIKGGILSARYIKADVKYLQIAASVNNGNSGGPLIDPIDNQVIAIVTRKHTGLTEGFDQLVKTIETNIDFLKSVQQPRQRIGKVFFAEHFLNLQEQFKVAAQELWRSANVGIGYAYELDQIKYCLAEKRLQQL